MYSQPYSPILNEQSWVPESLVIVTPRTKETVFALVPTFAPTFFSLLKFKDDQDKTTPRVLPLLPGASLGPLFNRGKHHADEQRRDSRPTPTRRERAT